MSAMHRLGCHRRALISCGARFNSTVAEAAVPRNRRHGVTLRWGTVLIPSREEILKIPKTKLYSPDLSYLKKDPKISLAGRLVKPKLQRKDVSSLTEQRRQQRLAREQKIAELSTPVSTSETKTLDIKPPDIAAITQKRIEQRLAREAEKAHIFNETIRTVQHNADKLSSLGSLFNSPGPLPLARSTGYPSVECPDDELSPLALKRREERRLRLRKNKRDQASRRNKERRESTDLGDMEATAENLDSVDSATLEAASPAVHAPEFNGPDSIPKTIDVFNNFGDAYRPLEHGQRSIKVSESPSYLLNPSIIDSFAGGDYSRYISLSSASETASPIASTAVNTAELALSYQRDYVISQRKHVIKIVKTLVGANSAQVTKEPHRACSGELVG